MYRNLKAEMARNNITAKHFAECLGVRLATIYDKMNGRYSFTLNEAFKIKNEFFPNSSLEYLFEVGNKTA